MRALETCDPKFVYCQISEVNDTLTAWNWNSFTETALATLIGGILGLVAVWFGFWLQRQYRYRELLDDCIVKVLEYLPVQAAEYQRVRSDLADYYVRLANQDHVGRRKVRSGSLTKVESRPSVDHLPFAMLLEVALMRARRRDQQMIEDALRAHEAIKKSLDPAIQLTMLGDLGGALSRWRARTCTSDEARASIAQVIAMAEPTDVLAEVDGTE